MFYIDFMVYKFWLFFEMDVYGMFDVKELCCCKNVIKGFFLYVMNYLDLI